MLNKKYNSNDFTEQILKNQLVIIHALSALLTPHCRGSMLDTNSETRRNVALIDMMHKTEELLNIGYGDLPNK